MKIKIIIWTIIFLIGSLIINMFIGSKEMNSKLEPTYGVTFSKLRAENLKLDWRKTYLSILDDLNVRHLRLGAYWPDIEKEEGIYDFSNLDWQIEQAEKRGAAIILVIGRRLPGWPECHIPEWANQLPEPIQQEKILSLIERTIRRYKEKSLIKYWQVENEPFLSRFGVCPAFSRDFFERELSLVKSLDNRPIIVSESGELSTWFIGARYGDILGITIYRTTWNKYFKYFHYPYPAFLYHWRGKLINFLMGPKKIIVVELQAEPWAPTPLVDTPLEEQYKTMNLEKFQNVIKYAKRTGFDEFYLWGAEWWYWLKQQGNSSIWQTAKDLWIKR